MPDIRHASFTASQLECRSEGDGQRIVEGLAVPWDQPVETGGFREQFRSGAFDDSDPTDAALYYEHGGMRRGEPPIGVIERGENRKEGYWIRARLSKTARADEVYQLLQDKALRAFSVGFSPDTDEIDKDTGTVTRSKARLREVSVAAFPIYAGATVSAVRSHDTETPTEQENESMPEDTITYASADDLAETRSAVEDIQRRFGQIEAGATINGAGADSYAGLTVRSMAEFVKGLADGSTRQQANIMQRAYEDVITRAYADGSDGETTDSAGVPLQTAFIARDIKLVTERRRVMNLFAHETLPASGLSVTFPKFGSASGEVDKQAAEGDDLNYLNLTVTTGSADIGTYGGYSALSRQIIERSDVPYLSKVLQRQLISYGKRTNTAVRSHLAALTGTQAATLAADPAAGDYIDMVAEGVSVIEENSADLAAEFWIMALADFKALAKITDSAGRPMFVINGDGVNSIGNVSVRTLAGNVAGLPVWVDPGATAGTSWIGAGDALTVMEAGPYNLDDENIVNLSKGFSTYGYLAITDNDLNGLVKVTHTPAA